MRRLLVLTLTLFLIASCSNHHPKEQLITAVLMGSEPLSKLIHEDSSYLCFGRELIGREAKPVIEGEIGVFTEGYNVKSVKSLTGTKYYENFTDSTGVYSVIGIEGRSPDLMTLEFVFQLDENKNWQFKEIKFPYGTGINL